MTGSFDNETVNKFMRLAERERLLPIRITPHYRRLIEQEVMALQGTHGPLYKVAYPTRERISVRAPGEVRDFVRDHSNMPPGLENVAIRKYGERVLYLITCKCAGHCAYCFRQDILVDRHVRPLVTFETGLDRLVEYLRGCPEVQEVILSGGDPLNVPFEHLDMALRRIRDEAAVPSIRVHTRNIVYTPRAFTDRICHLFRDYDVRLVFHVVHPYELEEEAVRAIRRVQSLRVRCYSQFPVLRGVNDHVLVLERLLHQFDDLGVRPLSLFIPDPIHYSASFRIPLARLFSIIDDLNWHTPAWINAVRLVLDTPVGKVRREDMVHWDKERNLVTFARDGKRIVYPDFPQELDVPGNINVLFWKSRGGTDAVASGSASGVESELLYATSTTRNRPLRVRKSQ